jgi:hypothetical protein
MYLVQRQLSFIASKNKFNESPMRLVCNSFSGEFYGIISQSSSQLKKLNWLSWVWLEASSSLYSEDIYIYTMDLSRKWERGV